MDPRLFDTVWEVYRESGAERTDPCEFRLPLARDQRHAPPALSAVAKNSQHMQGKAMDFYLPDVSTVRLRAIAMRIQNGGVGYYPNAYTPFVHLDVGSVRAWPRMTRDQLADSSRTARPSISRPTAARCRAMTRRGPKSSPRAARSPAIRPTLDAEETIPRSRAARASGRPCSVAATMRTRMRRRSARPHDRAGRSSPPASSRSRSRPRATTPAIRMRRSLPRCSRSRLPSRHDGRLSRSSRGRSRRRPPWWRPSLPLCVRI